MGIRFRRRHGAAAAVLMATVIAGGSLRPSSNPPVAFQAQAPKAPATAVDTEVLAATENQVALPAGVRILDLTGDAEVDLPQIDPSVVVLSEFGDINADLDDIRTKYVSSTDELVIGINNSTTARRASEVTVAIDLDMDGTHDLTVPSAAINQSNGTNNEAADGAKDVVIAIASFSELTEIDSLNFAVNAIDGDGDGSSLGYFSEALPVVLDAVIGDVVFADTNGDGVHGDNEQGIAGVLVTLLDETGSATQQATSGPDGSFAFITAAGTYAIEVDLREGVSASPQTAGDDRSADSNIGSELNRTALFFVGPGEENLTIDVGLIPDS